MNNLQKALKINALFSSISGIILILLNKHIAKLYGTSNNTVFWIVGLILVYFAITIWYEIAKQRKLAVIWIIIQDYTWVLGSIFLILFNPFQFTLFGIIATGIIAFIVFLMGINQMIGLKKVTVKNK
jgi:hypothetical protein